jgi:hypothetical protein
MNPTQPTQPPHVAGPTQWKTPFDELRAMIVASMFGMPAEEVPKACEMVNTMEAETTHLTARVAMLERGVGSRFRLRYT